MKIDFNRLSDREKRYLRLSHRGYSSKEIGGLEGCSEDTVSKVFNRARARFGNIARRDLARQLYDWEKANPDGRSDQVGEPAPTAVHILGDQILPLAAALDSGPEHPADQPSAARGQSAEARHEGGIEALVPLLLHPAGMIGSGRNDLKKTMSIIVIFVIAAASALTAGALLTLFLAFDRIAVAP